MKRIFAVLVCVTAFACFVWAQDKSQPRVIEVSGSAERMVTPDVFTFKITLAERIENKQKVTIDQQDTLLRNELSKLGVDVANDLSIYDMSSAYFRQKRVKDVLATKDYRLKLRDLNKIANLQDMADRINVAKLDLIDTESSEIMRLRQETKIDAIRAAKAKADYLLGAIGQRPGNAVFIQEVDEEAPRFNAAYTANATSNVVRVSGGVLNPADDSLSFTQIKLRYVILARFEMQ